MKIQTITKLFREVGLLTVALTLALVANFAYGQWSNPTAAPTGGNVAAPINVSNLYQYKLGNFAAIDLIAETKVRSNRYCDFAGNNCFVPADVGRSVVFANNFPTCASGQVLTMQSSGTWGCGSMPVTPAPAPAPTVTYSWQIGSWGSCTPVTAWRSCGTNAMARSRSVSCISSTGAYSTDAFCPSPKPATSEPCASVVDTSSCRCFIAGTKVTMADGTTKNIEDVEIGEFVLGKDGVHNEVLAFERPMLGERELYSINGSAHFVTPAHPFLTTDGWKSINMAEIHRENTVLVGELGITELQIGDEMIKDDGSTEVVTSIVGAQKEDQQLYNFYLGGDGTYFVDGFLTHDEFHAGETLESIH